MIRPSLTVFKHVRRRSVQPVPFLTRSASVLCVQWLYWQAPPGSSTDPRCTTRLFVCHWKRSLLTSDQSWLPTTPRERVFLFSLSLSLMLNTTVVLLLVTGDLPVLSDFQDKPTAALAEQLGEDNTDDVVEAIDLPVDSPTLVVVEAAEPRVAEVVPVAGDAFEPTPVVSAAPPAIAPDPIAPVQQAQPKQDDDPVTFFGVGLE